MYQGSDQLLSSKNSTEGRRTTLTYLIASHVERIAAQTTARTTYFHFGALAIGNKDVNFDLIVLTNHVGSTIDFVVVDQKDA